MKTSTLHRHRHPVHWHASMVLAIAALLLTATKCSGEMLRALQAVPTHTETFSTIFLRDAENMHLPVILNSGIRRASFSGR